MAIAFKILLIIFALGLISVVLLQKGKERGVVGCYLRRC